MARPAWWCGATVRVAALSTALATGSAGVQAVWTGDIPPISGREVAGLAVLAVLFALSDRFVITFPVRRGSHTLSLSEIPLVIGLLLVHPALLAAVRLAGGVVGLSVFRGQRGSKLGFNLALYLTQITVAAAVFHALTYRADPFGVVGWAGAYAATFAADLASVVAVTGVIAIHDDSQEWRRLLTADVRGLVQAPLVAVTTTLGLITAIMLRDRWPAAVLLAVLSLAVYRVFQRYAQQTQGHAQVEALYGFTRTLSGSCDADEVARVVLGQVRDLTRAESAELLVRTDTAVVRMRLDGRDDIAVGDAEPQGPAWWQPAAAGTPVLLPEGREAAPVDGAPRDAMAVPVALDDASGVLTVCGSLPDIPTFTAEHLRLMQALGAHAGVALTNARLVERLSHIGSFDTLTGLPNRRRLLADLAAAIERQAGTATVVGVLLLDLDRFKEINDALGHAIGDSVLREVGRRLQRRFGDRATVARLGGDEFALVVPDAAGTGEVLELAADLHRTVAELIEVGELTVTTPASIGVCFSPDHGADPDQLLQRADVAMYAAKEARTGVRVYSAEDDRNTPRRLALMADLRAAIETRALEVVYQPKVDPASHRVLGAEALCRWRQRDGFVPPDEFIPLAERSGLIRPLTRHVLDTALAACASWRRSGYDMGVAVNLSPDMIADAALPSEVRDLLRAHALPPAVLTLEITETGIMADPTHGVLTLEALRALGVKLSIDDFGTGHSSLGRLADLPIQEVKIDKGFVRDLTTQPGRRAVTDAALHLGRALDLIVVAEGVETVTEFEYVRDHGCTAVQGYYVSRPLAAADFAAWLAEWSVEAGSRAGGQPALSERSSG